MAVKKTHHELLHTTFNWNDFSRKQLERKPIYPPTKSVQKVVRTTCSATQTDVKVEPRKDDSQGDNSTRSHTTRKQQTSENRK
jgi:hypothetical protein